MAKITRFLPVDWDDLFRQAGIAPRRCKVARSSVAQAWCLFIEEEDGLQLIEIKPPQLAPGETSVRIVKGHWVFET